MKPVHFATSFLLALTGRYYRLEYLNKASVPKTAPRDGPRVRDEYPSDRLHSRLVELGKLNPSVDLEAFRTLRAHLNAAYNNDGSALVGGLPSLFDVRCGLQRPFDPLHLGPVEESRVLGKFRRFGLRSDGGGQGGAGGN